MIYWFREFPLSAVTEFPLSEVSIKATVAVVLKNLSLLTLPPFVLSSSSILKYVIPQYSITYAQKQQLIAQLQQVIYSLLISHYHNNVARDSNVIRAKVVVVSRTPYGTE